MPADPLGRKGRVVLTQRSEAQVLPAVAQHGVATRKLATHAFAGMDALGIEPFPKRDDVLFDSNSYHEASNLRWVAVDGKARSRSEDLQHDPLRSAPVPLAVEDTLPGSQIQLTVRDRYDHLVADRQVA